jgi:hypothetical protein
MAIATIEISIMNTRSPELGYTFTFKMDTGELTADEIWDDIQQDFIWQMTDEWQEHIHLVPRLVSIEEE